LAGKHEGKRWIGRPRREWEKNVIGCHSKWVRLWVYLGQDADKWGAHAEALIYLRLPLYAGNFSTGFSWMILPHEGRDLEKIYTQSWFYGVVLGEAWFLKVSTKLLSLCACFCSTF
jgi:hypothetical protein